jgi:DNA polymerase III epsilon subunit-like protein
MQNELLRFNKQQKFLVIDTETEGLNLVTSRPWQVSWIVAQNDRILEEHDIYIKWKHLNISEEAAKITGFSREDYERQAVPNNQAWEIFEKYLYDPQYRIVGQNLLGFDVYMINVWRQQRKMESDYSFLDRIIDTKSLTAAILKNIPVDKQNFLAWQYKMLNHREKGLKTSQASLLKRYNIDHDPKKLHNSLYDVQMNYKIFRKQLFEIEV